MSTLRKGTVGGVRPKLNKHAREGGGLKNLHQLTRSTPTCPKDFAQRFSVVQLQLARIAILMKTTILRWSGVTAAALSSIWVVLLAALILRCKWSGRSFPVLAKFSPFHDHLMLTDRWLTSFPAFASLAVLLLGAAWYYERSFRSIQFAALVSGVFFTSSLVVVVLNPGGYFSWFLS